MVSLRDSDNFGKTYQTSFKTSTHVLPTDVGEEELVKDGRAEVLVRKLGDHRYQESDERMEERVVKRAAVLRVGNYPHGPDQGRLVLGAGHVERVVHGEEGGDAAVLNVGGKGVGRRARVLDDGERRLAFVRRKLGVEGADLVVDEERHEGGEEADDDVRAELGLAEHLAVNHVPGLHADGHHPEQEDQDVVVLKFITENSFILLSSIPRGTRYTTTLFDL